MLGGLLMIFAGAMIVETAVNTMGAAKTAVAAVT